jgi:hypothetical protein
MKFYKISDELFVNLYQITNVWTETASKHECVYFSLSGEPESRYRVEGNSNIRAFCAAIDIEFAHRFYGE